MDIKAKIEEIVNKAKSDKDFAAKLQKDPVKTVEDLLGVDLPDEQIKAVVEGVKAKLLAGDGNIVDKIKGLFDGKKDGE
ncbi:MAG: hypothetical protein IKI21_03040 [Oscillospiraceae bacterium]|nr:hypothetical protein [Oscillospiraceae bacterium]